MAIRNPRNWFELEQTLKEIFGFKDQFTSQNLDFHGRQIKNASPSVDPYDYVVRKELTDLVGSGLSQPPLAKRGGGQFYDKITFGIGIGGSVTIGVDLTPPFIWSNSTSGKPDIIMVACNIPPTGDDIDFNIKRNGTSIFSTGKFIIPAGTGVKSVVSSTSVFTDGLTFSRSNVMSIDVTKIGSTIPGQGIEIVIFCKLI